MTVQTIYGTFSVYQQIELYKIINMILTCGKVYVNVDLDFLSNDCQKEAAKLIINEAIKDMPCMKVVVFYVG